MKKIVSVMAAVMMMVIFAMNSFAAMKEETMYKYEKYYADIVVPDFNHEIVTDNFYEAIVEDDRVIVATSKDGVMYLDIIDQVRDTRVKMEITIITNGQRGMVFAEADGQEYAWEIDMTNL